MAALAAPPAPAARSPWAVVVCAMGQTGGASLLGGLLNMASMKIIAMVLGPAQVALLATLQQLRLSALTAATLNGQTALVQGASATHGGDRRDYLRTVLTLMAAATVLTTCVLAFGAPWIAQLVGLEAARATLIRWLAIPVALAGAFVYLAALLNALGAIGRLAVVQLAAPAALAIFAYPAARAAADERVWVGYLALSGVAAIVAAGVALVPYRTALADWFRGPAQTWSAPAARRFFAISLSILATGLVSTWTVLAVRARILSAEGLETAGQFDAAWAISMSQAALVLASLQTYYLPALARTTDRDERAAQIKRVLLLAAGASATVVVALAMLKPLALTVLYSSEFHGASRYLRWTLIGDYLKVTSWILSIPLVASADMGAFLAADLAAYAAFFGGSVWIARALPPAEAAAAAFVLMYLVHLAVCGGRLWQRREFRPSVGTSLAWLAGLAAVLTVSALFWNV